MCRSIKQLRQPDIPATPDDIEAAARQFVRKVSGFRTPSRANEAVFEAAIRDISAVTERLLASLAVPAPRRSQSAGLTVDQRVEV